MNLSYWLLLAAVGLAVVGASFLVLGRANPEAVTVESASLSDMQIEIADTNAARVQGLSGRSALADDYGMLFVFEDVGRYGFWMKDMYLVIDIIWIKDNGEIVGIEREVSPETYPTVFYPPEPVRYVLEIAGGSAERRGFLVGARINVGAAIEKN
ncbi:MAG: DUF192 domain-containing protein [Candidatus Pacebacteria bacterium]|nr:DUF192 domain-containing protein [Candidatus Paceibacterota bacterium]MBP9840356.1 DUF192 domain-containing protein [Candidatus Paceibacterota bacterium]